MASSSRLPAQRCRTSSESGLARARVAETQFAAIGRPVDRGEVRENLVAVVGRRREHRRDRSRRHSRLQLARPARPARPEPRPAARNQRQARSRSPAGPDPGGDQFRRADRLDRADPGRRHVLPRRTGQRPRDAQGPLRGVPDSAVAVDLDQAEHGHRSTPSSSSTRTRAGTALDARPEHFGPASARGRDGQPPFGQPFGGAGPPASIVSIGARLARNRPGSDGYRGRLIPSFTLTTAGNGTSNVSSTPAYSRPAAIRPAPDLKPLDPGHARHPSACATRTGT